MQACLISVITLAATSPARGRGRPVRLVGPELKDIAGMPHVEAAPPFRPGILSKSTTSVVYADRRPRELKKWL